MSLVTTAFLAVLRKEFQQILRDKRMLPLLLVAPVIQVLAFGYAVNFDVDNLETVVCDNDRTPTSRDMTNTLFADGTFRPAAMPGDCARPEEEIRAGRAQVVVVIPAGTAQSLLAERNTQVQVMVDGTNPTIGRAAANATTAFFQYWSQKEAQERLNLAETRAGRSLRGARLAPETRLFFNPAMESSIFMVPGVSALVLIVVTMIATAMGLAREKEMGTMEQVVVTPIAIPELLAGKVLPFVIFGLVDILAVLVLSVWVFDVPVRGSLSLYFLGTLLYLLNTVGMGLFVSTISRNQQQALLTGFLILMPSILLSGIMTPIASMPGWLQPFTYLNPIRYYGEILRGVMLKGAGLSDLYASFAGLAIFGVAFFVAASLRFSKRVG